MGYFPSPSAFSVGINIYDVMHSSAYRASTIIEGLKK